MWSGLEDGSYAGASRNFARQYVLFSSEYVFLANI